MQSSAAHAELVLSYVAELRDGNVLNGKYRIGHQLGAGGMGAVYAARHVELGTKLAIKVLLPELLDDAGAVARFRREARAAAKIADDNVVRILDVGQIACGAPYIVMEFLEGQDGEVYRAQHAPLAIGQIVDFVLQACSAVAAAHALGIVHRDLKPANLFFVARPDRAPLVKVLDFGLSKVVSVDNKESGLTKSGSVFGSPSYSSPEQWRDAKHVDRRSDIWSLGVILYELLTGTLPFTGDSVGIIAVNVFGHAPRLLHELREDVPADLERVVLRCLEKNPGDRFQDVQELVEALRACQRRLVGALRRRMTPSSATTQRLPARSIARKRRLVAMGAFALVALLTVAAIGAVLYGRRRTPAPPRLASPLFGPAARELDAAPSSAAASPAVSGGDSPGAPSPLEATSASAPLAAPKTTAVLQRHIDAGAKTTPVGCDPPYYFDPQGNRVFKVECL
jgi:serine/threonine-protein kinase